MMANNEKLTILYGRLSQEDDREGESNSIGNQRLILEKYAAETVRLMPRILGRFTKYLYEHSPKVRGIFLSLM